MKWILPCLVLLVGLCGAVGGVEASRLLEPDDDPPLTNRVPPTLNEILDLPRGFEAGIPPGLEIRKDAMREAAISLGARSGLSRRTWEIRQDLARRAEELSRTFDFRHLLIALPSGLLLEPPVVGEAQDALRIANAGRTAAVADRVYNIGKPARIVSAPRTWQSYLERDWGDVKPPPILLLPKTQEERILFQKWVREGWQQGYDQADWILEADLNRLIRDFTGMVRYRKLLAQGIISEPFTIHEDRGVTGGGNEMRVGDRAVHITNPSALEPKVELWSPVDR